MTSAAAKEVPVADEVSTDEYDPNRGRSFNAGHQDLITNVSYNLFGTRIVTASSDHRVKVWDVNKKSKKFDLVDTWKAHDAEVLDAKWISPWIGQAIGSIGDDMKFKVWIEDSGAAMNSGRRFTFVFAYSNPSNIPFSSISFKTLRETETYVALLSRDARMRVFTTSNDPDALNNWTEHSTFLVCDPPPRGDETAFKVEFHDDTLPNWALLNAGLPSTSVSFLVAAMNTAKIYRTNANNRFYQAAELLGHHSLVRDIAWCPGSLLGYEVIATASKDGRVRIFEVHVDGAPDLYTHILNYQPSQDGLGSALSNGSQDHPNAPSQPSGIGAGLQGTSNAAIQELDSGSIEEIATCVTTLPDEIGLQWKLKWTDAAPKMLITAGDDAEVRFWAKSDQGLYTLYGTVTRDV